VPDVPALFIFQLLLRREDAHPSRRFFLMVQIWPRFTYMKS